MRYNCSEDGICTQAAQRRFTKERLRQENVPMQLGALQTKQSDGLNIPKHFKAREQNPIKEILIYHCHTNEYDGKHLPSCSFVLKR